MNLRFEYKIWGGSLLPLLEIQLLSRTKRVAVPAVVDSGAEVSIFGDEIRMDLNIATSEGVHQMIRFGGSSSTGLRCMLYAEFGGHRFNLPVVFIKEYTLPYALLGREGFFPQFGEVAFSERRAVRFVELRR